MNSTVLFALFATDPLANSLCKSLNYIEGKLTTHHFPDGESLITLETDVKHKTVILLAYLDHPDSKIMQLILTAETVRALGADKIILIAPYLPYMRQDKRFHPGEGISSEYFARLISQHFDYLLTIDPHLHRWHALSEIYTIPTQVSHAASVVAAWIQNTIENPVLLGPDGESAQWVAEIAKQLNAPYVVLTKERFGDEEIESSMPEVTAFIDRHIVVIDDIISSAVTMIESVEHLKQLGIENISCICIHPIFAKDAYQKLKNTGVKNIVSCNTVAHESNQIDISKIIINDLQKIFQVDSRTSLL